MRSLSLLALLALAAFPLSARDHWREVRPVVVVETSRCAPYHRWEDRRWEDRWEHHGWYRRHGCDDARILLRPLVPPFPGRVDFRFR
jgi:hypothetical protein